MSLPTRQPDNETGIYLHRHKHQWREVGTHTWPSGHRQPVFRCSVCGDRICTDPRPASADPKGTTR